MKKIADKKLLGYFKEILLDFEMSNFPKTEQIEVLKRSLKQVIKNSKISKLNVSLIYTYSLYHLSSVEDSKNLMHDYIRYFNLDFQHYEKHRKQINKEWKYIQQWFENEFDIQYMDEMIYVSDKNK